MKAPAKNIFFWIPPVLLVLLVFGGFLFIQGKLAFAVGESKNLVAPTISISHDIYYPLDEILYIEGRVKPDSTIEIQFQKQGARPLKFVSKSDANGEWVLAEKVPLEAGDWEVRVRALEGKDKVSAWSNPRVFKVIVSGIVIGGINIKFAALSFLIVILII